MRPATGPRDVLWWRPVSFGLLFPGVPDGVVTQLAPPSCQRVAVRQTPGEGFHGLPAPGRACEVSGAALSPKGLMLASPPLA